MNLLFILSEYLPDSGGGIISHYARILPGLVERGHGVKVLVANHGSLDRAARVEDGVEVEYLLPVAWAAWAQAQEFWFRSVLETNYLKNANSNGIFQP